MKAQRGGEVTIKKYSNRRLYDTSDSRYITLEELAQKIRGGSDVRVIDAKSGGDLTQATLAQIILESRRAARLLPAPLLTQLIRMGDDALSEFFSSYMSWALDIYLQARQGAQAIAPFNPFATLPFSGASALARMFSNGRSTEGSRDPRPKHPAANPNDPQTSSATNGHVDLESPAAAEEDLEGGADPVAELAELRREIQALKLALNAEPEGPSALTSSHPAPSETPPAKT